MLGRSGIGLWGAGDEITVGGITSWLQGSKPRQSVKGEIGFADVPEARP